MTFGATAPEAVAPKASSIASACAHCGLPSPPGARFCCPGCAAAYETIQALGFGQFYDRRLLDPSSRPPRPEAVERFDLAHSARARDDGAHELTLAVEGLQCGACVWLIEHVLAREPGVQKGRVNMTTRRLSLVWTGAADDADRIVGSVEALGYRLVPFDANALGAAKDRTEQMLLRALGVAGFAAGNVMLISIGVWAGLSQGMGPATRDLMHWVSALIAMPAIAYAGMPFFRSAFAALRHGRTNMDVPVTVGVCLVTGMSLAGTISGADNVYFDSAATLLFFLLIGRVLDHRARGKVRATAEQLLTLRGCDVLVIGADGATRRCRAEQVAVGDCVAIGMGERAGVDGVVVRGSSLLDSSLVTGESLPAPAELGTQVFAGTLNLGAPLVVRVTARGDATLLAECVRLIQAAEERRGRFVILADRVARFYTPVVHVAALLTFAAWYFIIGAGATASLLIACSVLLVTCPCALGLAIPAVQVIATGRLLRAGILLKSPTALERLASIDTVLFDKTGTLTEPMLSLDRSESISPDDLALARGIASASRHPLARALVAAELSPVAIADGVVETPGEGLSVDSDSGVVRLGSAAFCGVTAPDETSAPAFWLSQPGRLPIKFRFSEQTRVDAGATIGGLRRLGLRVGVLSGDRVATVRRLAENLGIDDVRAECSPIEKVARIESLLAEGHRVLMVGDGLNDGPSLAAATVSASPASGADISQNVADIVFQGGRLAPVADAIRAARRARSAMRQNLALAIGYNLLLVPLAMTGHITPWLAAVAMSSSSLLVMANSFRGLGGRKRWA